MQHLDGRAPILVDDIIFSGRTMLEAVQRIVRLGGSKLVCIAVHGLFAGQSGGLLAEAGARVVTSDSIPHKTNEIAVVNSLQARSAISWFLNPRSTGGQTMMMDNCMTGYGLAHWLVFVVMVAIVLYPAGRILRRLGLSPSGPCWSLSRS